MISKSRAIELVVSYQVYNHNGNCPLCGHMQSSPYRRRDLSGNKVVEGCISVHHNRGDAWELRPSAQAWRRGQADGLLERWSQQDLRQLDEMGNKAYSDFCLR